MAQATVTISLALKGVEQLKQLQDAINKIGGGGSSGRGGGGGNAARLAEQDAIRLAQATARLQTTQGQLGAALNTLRNAYAGVNSQTIQGVRLQTQMAQVMNRISGQSQPLTQLFGALGGQISNLGRAGANLAGGLSGVTSSVSNTALALGRIHPAAALAAAGFAALVGGGGAVVGTLAAIAKAGIEVNTQMEQTRLGIATTIASVSDVTQNGVRLDGIEAVTATLGVADEQLKKLRIDALSTPLTFAQLADGFLQATGPGLKAGLTLDQIRKTSVALSQVIVPLTGHAEQLGQELRGLLSGDITKNTQIAKTLGITKEDVDNATRLGKLAEFLDEKLRVAAASGKLMAQTFEAARTNLQEAGNIIAGSVTEGLFQQLRDKINETLPQIFDQATGGISSSFSGIGDTLTAIFDTAGRVILELIDSLIGGLRTVSVFLESNKGSVGAIIESVAQIVRITGRIILDMITVGKTTQGAATATDIFAGFLKTAVVALAAIRDISNIVRQGFVLFGSTLATAFLAPLAAGARLLASVVALLPGVGAGAFSLASQVTKLADAAVATMVKAGSELVIGVRDFGKTGAEAIKAIDDARARAEKGLRVFNPRRISSDKGVGIKGRIQPDEKDTRESRESAEAEARSLRQAEQALDKAFADRAIALAKAEEEEQTRILQRQLEERSISIEQFYNELVALQKEATDREVDGIKEAIAARRKQVESSTGAEQLRAKAELVDLETRLNKAEAEGAAQSEQNSRNRIRALRDLAKEIKGIKADLLRASGDNLSADLTEIDIRFEDVLKRVRAQYGEFSEELKALLNLIGALKNQAQLSELNRRIDTISTREQTAVREVNALRRRGLIGEAEARKRIYDEEKKNAERIIRQLLQAQLLTKDPVERARIAGDIKAQRERIDLTPEREALGEIRRGIEQDVRGAFQNLFNDILNGTQTIGEAFRNLGQSILQSLNNALSQRISDTILKKFIDPILDKIFGSSGGGASGSGGAGGGGLLDGLFDKLGGKLGGLFSKIANGLGGLFSKIFGAFGFAEGGFTGAGARLQPAGVVHRGEYVFDQGSVDFFGVGALDRMRSIARRGYAGGGAVGDNIVNNIAGGGGRPPVVLNFYQNISGGTQQQNRRSASQIAGDAASQLKRYLDRDD